MAGVLELMALEWKQEDGYWSIRIKAGVEVTLEPRPQYCDRGNWIAKVESRIPDDIDYADFWPRYYMDFDRAKLEVEDWLRKRYRSGACSDA